MEDNQTLFDIIQTALDETLKATSQMYVLYDDVGQAGPSKTLAA